MQRLTGFSFAGVIAAMLACQAHAAPNKTNKRGPDRIDVDSTNKIRAYTTDKRFLTEWVDYLPASRRVPSPTKFLGYVIGTPNKLTQPARINAYFRALARRSRRVRVFSMGKSHGGREMIVAAIADAPLLAKLDAIKKANSRLADPRRTTEAEARKLAATTPPIYWVTAGLHSPETGPPEMVMELAFRLAVSEQPHIKQIRRGVITLITPVLEMDGRARMVDWYNRFLTKAKTLKDMPPRMAPYWGDYTAHDNNRDGLQMSQPLTRNFVETYHQYKPVVSLDLHESVPLLYVSMGTGPYNPTIDPITVTEWQWISSYEVSQLTKLGLQGVWTWGFYTGWYPGYLLWVTNNHNAIGRFYETFGNGHPGTFDRVLRRSRFAKRRVDTRQWYRPAPPRTKVKWSLRNNTNYMQSGVLASLQLVARHGETLLFNYWKKGQRAVDKGKSAPPYAFVIPKKQRDLGALHHFLWLASKHRVEVHEATAAATYGAITVSKGDYLVRMDQPYRGLAHTLLQSRRFPRNAEHTPYDDVAWSLDYMLGLEITAIADRKVRGLAMKRLDALPKSRGGADRGARWIIDHVGQASLASLRWALPQATLRALMKPWKGHPAGSVIVEGVGHRAVDAATRKLHLEAVALGQRPSVTTAELDAPRVAMFHTWLYTQDSGWARYALEQLGVRYTLINKDHLRRGNLRDAFDVIIVPNQGWLDLKRMINGIDTRWGPMPYTKTEKYPSHGVIDSSPDITGGMGFGGLANLKRFVKGGGVVLGLGSGGRLLSDSGIARQASARAASNPGSHVTTRVVRAEHPVTFGYGEISHVFRGRQPIFSVRDYWRGMVLMQFGTKRWAQAERDADKKAGVLVSPRPKKAKGKKKPKRKPLVLSGMAKPPKRLERAPAIVDVPVGKGRVVLYSFNPLHRYQNHHDFALLTNALLFWNDMPGTPTEKQMRARDAR